MDKRLEAAFDMVQYQNTLRNQRDLLERRTFEKLIHAQNGGLFTITPELITLVKMLIDADRERAILLDNNNTPIEIINLQEFVDTLLSTYIEVTNEYYVEYQSMREKRTVKDLVECIEES